MRENERDRLNGALRQLGSQMRTEQNAPLRMEGALRSEFRKYHAHRRARKWMAVAAIAACLVAVLTAALLLRRPAAIQPEVAIGRVPEAVDPLRVTPAPKDVPAPAMRKRRVVRKAPPRLAPAPLVAPAEVTTGFLPVGLGPTFGPSERGTLIRIRMPRSAMVSFGLPVNENRAAEVVNADVLLGEDGLARAIRFVQ